MKVFVTGGHGFLGNALCKKLVLEGFEVEAPTSKQCNLFSDTSLNQYADVKFDLIIHLAAWTQAGDFCLYHKGEQWINNQKINTNVLNWWHQNQAKAKLVTIGTSCSYAPDSELIEENYLKGEPIESLHTYAMTKRMLLEGVKSLNNQFGYSWLCVVPSTLYGPDYHTDGRQMHFIFDLIRKIIRAKELGEEVVLWGDGFQSREIIHVDDFIKSLLNLIENKVENEVVNIGFGEEHTIRDFAKSICKIVEYDFEKISYDTSKYTGAKSKCLSIKKISKLVPGFKSSLIPLDKGVENVVDWFYKTNSYI